MENDTQTPFVLKTFVKMIAIFIIFFIRCNLCNGESFDSVEFPYRVFTFRGEITKLPSGHKITPEFKFNFQKLFLPVKQPEEQNFSDKRPYVLQLKKGEKVITQSYPFGTCVNLDDMVCYDQVDGEGFFLTEFIPNLKEIPDNIVILYKGQEVYRKEKSKNIPIVNLLGQESDDKGIHLKWTGSDKDGDSLLYEVFVSEDDFLTFERVHPSFVGQGEEEAMKGKSFDFNFDEKYFAGSKIAFLILVNDGFNINYVISKTFNILPPKYKVKANIISPKNDEVYIEGFIEFDGGLEALIQTPGYLFDGKPYQWLPISADLEWYSNIDGLLEKSSAINGFSYCHCVTESLTPGVHTITLKAKSATGGNETMASVRIEIKPPPVGHKYGGNKPDCWGPRSKL